MILFVIIGIIVVIAALIALIVVMRRRRRERANRAKVTHPTSPRHGLADIDLSKQPVTSPSYPRTGPMPTPKLSSGSGSYRSQRPLRDDQIVTSDGSGSIYGALAGSDNNRTHHTPSHGHGHNDHGSYGGSHYGHSDHSGGHSSGSDGGAGGGGGD